MRRGAKVRLVRDDVVISRRRALTLKRFKDEVREVQAGQECGMAFANYHEIQKGDIIECYEVETIKRSLLTTARTAETDMPRHRTLQRQKGPSQRQLRVGEVPRHALSEILRENDIRDPELVGVSVTVTEVKPSPDMRHATVFVEPLGGVNAAGTIAAPQTSPWLSAR